MAHAHLHAQRPQPDHVHSHDPAAPHPAQAASWSILRMTMAARLAAALVVSVVLWVFVLVAMR